MEPISARDSELEHKHADTNSGPMALHHTLGFGANQASPGNHSHDGGTSVELPPIPVVQGGTFTITNLAASTSSGGSVVFPTPFAVEPVVVLTAHSSRLTCAVSAITINGFNWSISNWSPAAAIGTPQCKWIAVD